MWRAKARNAREFAASVARVASASPVARVAQAAFTAPALLTSEQSDIDTMTRGRTPSKGSSLPETPKKKRGRPPKNSKDVVNNATAVKKTAVVKKKVSELKKATFVQSKNMATLKKSVEDSANHVHPLILQGELNLDPLYKLFEEMKDTIESLNNRMYFVKKDVRAICDSLHEIIQKGE
jgi:hypothetical protein